MVNHNFAVGQEVVIKYHPPIPDNHPHAQNLTVGTVLKVIHAGETNGIPKYTLKFYVKRNDESGTVDSHTVQVEEKYLARNKT